GLDEVERVLDGPRGIVGDERGLERGLQLVGNERGEVLERVVSPRERLVVAADQADDTAHCRCELVGSCDCQVEVVVELYVVRAANREPDDVRSGWHGFWLQLGEGTVSARRHRATPPARGLRQSRDPEPLRARTDGG